MTSWQIYGCRDNEGSWSRVARGLEEGLRLNDQEVNLFATDNLGHDLDRPLPAGFSADVGIFVGQPGHASMLRTQGNHRHRWLMIAPNSTWLPREVLAELERTEAVTGYLTPSTWGQGILESYTTLPIRVWPHGVSGVTLAQAREAARMECARPPEAGPVVMSSSSGRVSRRIAFNPNAWRCLHLSSTQQDRKSTHALVKAFVRAVEPDENGFTLIDNSVQAQLTVVVDGPVGDVEAVVARTATTDLGRRAVKAAGRCDLSAAWMAHYMQSFDCIVQPSRAEGFGMVPLEARAAGVPVIMTDGTGHQEHVPTPESHDRLGFNGGYVTAVGVVVITTERQLELIDDGPDARAPVVREQAIMNALESASSLRHVLRPWASLWASAVQTHWSWASVTRRFLNGFREDA